MSAANLDASPSPDSLPPGQTRGSLAVIFLTVVIDLLGFAMVLPLLPVYAKKFGEDESGLLTGLLMASFSIMQFVFAPMWGRLSDRIGRRPVLLIGLAGAAVFYAVFGLATLWHSVTWLFISRIGAGIACATIPVAQAYIADTTTLEKRAKGMALIGAAFGVGFCFGPLIGAAAIFLTPSAETSPGPGFAAAGLSVLAFLLALVRLPESLRAGSPSAGRKLVDTSAWREALATPSVAPLLLASFVSVLSFGGFETTLALLLKDRSEVRPTALAAHMQEMSPVAVAAEPSATQQIASPPTQSLFRFSDRQVLLYFSFIGLVLSLAQGVLVRRLSGRIPEGTMATIGALLSVFGFALMIAGVRQVSLPLVMVASAVEVMGFAFMTPSLQSLVSRRSDPTKQGSIAGVSQSVSSLARIAGPLLAIPLFSRGAMLPYVASAAMMLVGLLVVQFAVRGGRDFTAGDGNSGRGFGH
jgi:MFS family permease